MVCFTDVVPNKDDNGEDNEEEESIEIDLEIFSSRKTDDDELTIISSSKQTKDEDDPSDDEDQNKIPTYPGLYHVWILDLRKSDHVMIWPHVT